jgi:adenosine deaminase
LAAETFDLTRSELFEISIRSIDAIFSDDEIKNELKQIWLDWKKEHNSEF